MASLLTVNCSSPNYYSIRRQEEEVAVASICQHKIYQPKYESHAVKQIASGECTFACIEALQNSSSLTSGFVSTSIRTLVVVHSIVFIFI